MWKKETRIIYNISCSLFARKQKWLALELLHALSRSKRWICFFGFGHKSPLLFIYSVCLGIAKNLYLNISSLIEMKSWSKAIGMIKWNIKIYQCAKYRIGKCRRRKDWRKIVLIMSFLLLKSQPLFVNKHRFTYVCNL